MYIVLNQLNRNSGNIAMGLQDTSLQSQSSGAKEKCSVSDDSTSSPLRRHNSSLVAATRGRQGKRPSIAPVPSQMDEVQHLEYTINILYILLILEFAIHCVALVFA